MKLALALILATAGFVPWQERQAFEVAAIKPNALGYIDLGGGLRVLSGRTQCQAADTRPIPGDPLPLPGMGRCHVRNSTGQGIIKFAHRRAGGPPTPAAHPS